MGLLDGFIPQDSQLGGSSPHGGLLSDPSTLNDLSMAMGLLRSRMGQDWPSLFAKNAAAKMAIDNQERQNRANDLQQIGGLYKMALQNDQLRALDDEQSGRPHVTDPTLATLQQKMMQLANLPGRSTGMPALSGMPPPQQAPAPVSSAGMPRVAVTGGPDGQNMSGGFPATSNNPMLPQVAVTGGPDPSQMLPSQVPQGMPQQQNALPTAQAMAAMARARSQGDRYAIMGMDKIAENRYKMGSPQLSRGVSFDPSTGLPLAGFVDNVPVTFDSRGNPTVLPSAIPQAIAQRSGMVTGAQESAKFPGRVENVTMAGGATVPKLLSDVVGNPFNQTPPIPQSVIDADRRGQPFTATQAPGGPVQFQRQSQSPNSADPFSTMPTIPQPTGIGQTTYDKALSEHRAGAVKDLAAELGTNASAAAQRIAINNQARELVDHADTGWLAGHIGEFRSVLGSLGVQSAADKAATDQVLAKDLIGTALQKGKQLFGQRFTQSEVGIMLSRASPAPEMQATAIKFLLDTDNATQQYAIQQSQHFGQYLGRNGDPLQFKGWYANAFPVSDALKGIRLGGNPAQATPTNLQQNRTALYKAQQAIQQGKPRDAVIQRLMEQGFSPEGL